MSRRRWWRWRRRGLGQIEFDGVPDGVFGGPHTMAGVPFSLCQPLVSTAAALTSGWSSLSTAEQDASACRQSCRGASVSCQRTKTPARPSLTVSRQGGRDHADDEEGATERERHPAIRQEGQGLGQGGQREAITPVPPLPCLPR